MPEQQQETYDVARTAMPAPLQYQLIIQNRDQTEQYDVCPVDAVKLTRGINCTPAKLDFTVLKDSVLSFVEGDVVRFSVNGEVVFQGFVFEKNNSSNEKIRVVAYDQLRYLKNKDCYVYKQLTATQLLKNICDDYKLTLDTDIANTQYVIPSRIEDNKTLQEIINQALDLTVINLQSHLPYFIYDDAGKICLKSLPALKTDVYIDAECLTSYEYQSSIDKDTFNMVKVVREAPGEQGKALVNTGVIVDNEHIKEWGRLQYLMRPDDKMANAIDRAKNIMLTKNRKTREIRLKGVLGDVRVRGGSSVYINLQMGDVALNNYFVVESVTHMFSDGQHAMDMDVLYYEQPANYEVTVDKDAAVYKQIQESKKKSRGRVTNDTAADGSVNPAQVDSGFTACDGRVSPYGDVGCVDTVCAAGSYYNPALKELYDQGCADTGTLCSGLEARGYRTEAFNGTANKGDILLYGDRDHAVISDGAGGCFGNSTSRGYATTYSDANYAWRDGAAPTEIIRMS